MAAVKSTMLELGTKAPAFSLPDVVTGKEVTLADFKGKKGLVVMFLCNHCPYVIHVRQALIDFAREYAKKGVAMVAISSNDVERYPDDSPEKMKEDALAYGYPFPYLYDETQEVARVYKAACTPDIYLFDSDLALAYRGQFDETRPSSGQESDGSDLREATDLLLESGEIRDIQIPSIGCNIKWKPGQEPDYYG